MSSNFQKTCKNKIAVGHRPTSIFHKKKNATGEIKLANGIRNRVNMSEVIASEKCGFRTPFANQSVKGSKTLLDLHGSTFMLIFYSYQRI